MKQLNLEAERRDRRARQRLGTDNPVCVACGESNPHCFEAHHIAGRRFGADLARVCLNCHRKLSDTQKDHPPAGEDPPSITERIGLFLLGLADLLTLAATRLKEFGAELIAMAASAALPGKGGCV